MLNRFYPDIYLPSIFELPLDALRQKSITALFFDIDNTVVPYDVMEATEKEIRFFKSLMDEGFVVCFISNNSKKRVDRFNKNIGANTLPRSGKPGTRKLLMKLKELEVSNKNAALIGDQVFTDVWCSHRAGVFSILVEPVSDRDQFITWIKRGAERGVLHRYLRRDVENGQNKL